MYKIYFLTAARWTRIQWAVWLINIIQIMEPDCNMKQFVYVKVYKEEYELKI